MFQFRDPIHGFIELTDLETKIVDSIPFQRLRNIKQLATTYLVYHGAEHTRFGHSLGVMHLVSKAFESVMDKNKNLFSKEKQIWYRQILRLIGLTHDLGHAPFSHASENLFCDSLKHEDYTREILFNTEIADIIKEIGESLVKEIGPQYNITPQLLNMIYDGKNVEMYEDYIFPDFKFLKSFVDGELDCDKMDYLLRDSYYCGVKYGTYDLDRLISSFTIYQPEEKVLLLAVERGGIHALEEFILARYFMYIQVYFHKTRRLLDKRLISCLEQVLPNGKYPVDINEYLLWDDNKVIEEIKKNKHIKSEADFYLSRKVMTCIYQSDIHINREGAKLFKLLHKTIKDEFIKLGIPEDNLENYVIIDEVDRPVYKIAEGTESEKAVPIIIEHQIKPSDVISESLLLKGLDKPISIRRIYVDKEYKEQVEKIINDVTE